MDSLPVFVRLQGQPVLVLGDGEAAEAKRRLVIEAGGIPTTDRSAGARIAFLTPECADAAAALRKAGMLVNVVDRPADCDFTVPAIVDRSPLIVAIGTGGASASLAKSLKERLEWLLDPALGAMAGSIHAAREEVAAVHRSVPARRAFWARLMAPGAPLDPLTPAADPAAAINAALSGGAGAEDRIDTIAVTTADALTLAQLRLMAQADLVVHDAAIAPDVLALVRRDAARHIGPTPPAHAAGRILLLQLAPAS